MATSIQTSPQRLLQRLRVAALAAVYAGGAMWTGAQAEDTEIYIGKVPGAQTPNVLFSIDTSGSMNSDVPGGGQSRIEAVKDALSGLINDTSNLKAGLGRYHRELGGPIIFPVLNTESTPSFLNDAVDISSIDRSTDDAEELADGTMILDSFELEMTEVFLGGGTTINEIEARPLASDDDDEEGTGGGLNINSPDLDDADSGVRFRNVAIPQGAVILHAEMEFASNSNASGVSDKIISGHDVDDSPAFKENGTDSVGFRLNNEKTTATLPWSNISDDADAGVAITTPNVYAIVQEIVNRAGWVSGNDMALLMENITDNHELSTFDGDFTPVLRVKYLEGATVITRQIDASERDANEGGAPGLATGLNGFYLLEDPDFAESADYSHAGLIFPNGSVPGGAEVVWADIQFLTRVEDISDPDDLVIQGILDPQLEGFSAGNLITDQPLTTSQVDWVGGLVRGDEEIFAPGDDDPLFTPNLAPLVEEIRALAAFDPTDDEDNNIGFAITDAPSAGKNQRHMCSFDGVSECPETLAQRPTLRLVYGFPPAGPPPRQEVGLRFNNVRVPQGAVIESAYLEFTVGGQTNDPGTLTIQIENSTEPKTYSSNAGETVSGRTYVGSSVAWSTDPWNNIGETRQSPDIASLVSQVTDQGDWCGGGSLAFRLTSSDAQHIAEAWDKGLSGAPTLRIDYDATSLAAGEGCTTRRVTVPIDDSDDDIEEDNGTGSIDFDSDDLDIESGYLVGLRFDGIEVPQGATVLSANLLLAADDPTPDSGTNNITIRAERHPNAPPFTNANGDLSSRDLTSDANKLVWTEDTTWNEGEIFSPLDDGVNLAPLIADIIDGTLEVDGEKWASGNALVFTLQGDATDDASGDRDAEVCCNNPNAPASLEIFYEVLLGDVSVTGLQTARQAMLNIIDDLVADGWTPPVDAALEGAYYFAGEPVHFGRTRGGGEQYDGSNVTSDTDLDEQIQGDTDDDLLVDGHRSRLSHFATYSPQGANIVREGNCTETDPNNTDCNTERIDNLETGVTYVSPFDSAQSCEKGFMVLLSDGIANRNSSEELIKTFTGQASCDLNIPNINASGDPNLNGDGSFATRNPSVDEICGLELVEYLHDTDFIDEPSNPDDVLNNVRTFTIGFDLTGNNPAVEFLKALAFVGNGGDLSDPDGVDGVQYGDGFYEASNAQQLQDVFEVIVQEIIEETTSFVAPGISINAFNRLFNQDDIYFSLFRPDDNVAWLGNLKKFKLCSDQATCEFGETIDTFALPAVNDDETNLDTFGTLKLDADGFWSDDTDRAPEIAEGGAGEQIPAYTDRTVYVNTSAGTVPDPDFSDPVESQGTALREIDLTSDTDAAPADASGYNDLKTALLDSNNCDSGFATIDEQNDCLNELIEWITGKKFSGDLPRDGTESDVNRWAFGDPMHSRPLVLTYGKDDNGTPSDPDDDKPLSKIFLGTNDGGFRMINEGDGVEEWIFFPNSMLTVQSELKDNPKGSHEYGVDDTPTARIKDVDDDGVIEPADGDFVHLYYGLRRGGKQVFAINATPDGVVGLDTQQTNNQFTVSIGEKGNVVPELLWRIDGSVPEFQRLGQTWSTQRPVRIAGNNGPVTALIFGGGYDTAKQDGDDNDGTLPDGGDQYGNASTTSQGNAVFIVDANTGERLWWASSSVDGNGDAADTVVAEMNTSIAAPVTPVDIDGDTLIDRLYLVDLRGQVFRVDIAAKPSPAAGESEFADSTVGLLASLGPDDPTAAQPPNQDRRKFFYAPEVARVDDQALTGLEYELIGIVSGNRSSPQAKTVLDRVYALRDFETTNPSGGLDSSYPKCNPLGSGCTDGEPIDNDALTDVTEQDSFVIRQESDGAITLVDSDSNELSDSDTTVQNLRNSNGWRFDLEGDNFDDPLATDLTGEKGFSAVTVLGGNMFFTTFLPPDLTTDPDDICSAPEVLGTSRFYAIDFFTGAPAFDRNEDGTFAESERFTGLGAGPSADVVPAYLPGGVTLPVPTGAGAVPQDPGITQRVNKSFWLEER